MSQVAANADVYAEQRLGVFFPGVIPSLDGQCVSLAKAFMQDMSEVPNPQAARGDARYVGKNLVAQGHAVEVPYSQRRRGDIICYEYGLYGHIGVVLSGNRTFEQNVNWDGVPSKIVDGARVYASRIGSLSESWRHDQHIYRLNTYKEGGGGNTGMYPDAGQATNLQILAHGDLSYKPTQEEVAGAMKIPFSDWVGIIGQPDRGAAINYIRTLKLDITYEPSAKEIADAQAMTHKMWLDRLAFPNDGDATNFIRADKGDSQYNPSDAEKAAAKGTSFKGWAYKFSSRVNNKFVQVTDKLFKEVK